jgi:hypothetical protein
VAQAVSIVLCINVRPDDTEKGSDELPNVDIVPVASWQMLHVRAHLCGVCSFLGAIHEDRAGKPESFRTNHNVGLDISVVGL